MANHAEPVTMATAFVEDAEAQARFVARRRYLAWRGRLLPVGAVIVFLLVWWQAVEIFDIKPFIAPSPVAVAKVLYDRFDMLMANLLHSSTNNWNAAAPIPTGTELFTYKAAPPQGTVHGTIQGNATCIYN